MQTIASSIESSTPSQLNPSLILGPSSLRKKRKIPTKKYSLDANMLTGIK